jgi:hypothetical protein
MHEEELYKRAKEIHIMMSSGNTKEAKEQFKKLVEDTVSYCKHCKKYVTIELDKTTRNKPFYFCTICGQDTKKLNIDEEKLIDLKFHRINKTIKRNTHK